MSRTASISTTLPDAGKPVGRCEECGPHGNGGRVELLFSVVDCLVCAWRADFDALRKVDDFKAELRAGVQAGERVAFFTQEISPLDPARVWGRRVKVTCSYLVATDLSVVVGPPDPRPLPPIDPRGLGFVILDPCSRCGKTTINCARMMNLITSEWVHIGPSCP